MDVDRNELIQALERIKPGIASKEFIEQSTHFVLSEGEVSSYNGDMSVSYPFAAGVECTVDSSLFFKLINRMEEDTLEMELEENLLKLTCGDITAELPVIIESEVIQHINKIAEEQENCKWHSLPKDFIEALRLCRFSASKDQTLGTLTCVWVEGEDVLATDRLRISWYKMESPVEKNFYIDAHFVKEIMAFDNIIEYALSDSWAHFQVADGTIFSARLTKPEDLIDLREHIDSFEQDVRIAIPADLRPAIETASITVMDDEKAEQEVTLEFGDDLIRCYGRSERGAVTQEIHLHNKLNIEPFSVIASTKSMIEILDKATHLLVGKGKALFRSREKKGFRHLLALKNKE
jgi:hypothetical protein